MRKRARERKKLREESQKILEVSSRLALEDYLSSEQEEQAMTVIAAAQDVKARKRSWQDTEDEIINSGQAACLCCASC